MRHGDGWTAWAGGVLAAALAASPGCRTGAADPVRAPDVPAATRTDRDAGTSAPRRKEEKPMESIGSATMKADGTIVLQLRATGPDGERGDALATFPPDHPAYKQILEHLGGMKPGESKPVPPWPDDEK